MSKQLVNIGAQADDNTGDPLRSAFDKINDNFNEVYSSLGDGTDLSLAIDDDGNIDISNDLTVTGNLVVNGQTTTVSSETVTFEDNILLINKADTDDTPYNTTSAGIEIQNTETNPSFIHTFGDSTWTLSNNLSVDGNIIADNLTVAGSIIHEGDTDTNIAFTNNEVNVNAGGGKSARLYNNTIRLEESNSSNVAVELTASSSQGQLKVYSQNVLSAFIQGAGNNYINGGSLGIGTPTPGAKLDIHTATNSNGLLIREDTDDSITHNFYVDGSDNGSILLNANDEQAKVLLNSAGNSYFNGGNLGVGTDSPDAKLEIRGRSDSSDITMRFTDTDGSVIIDQDHSNIEYYTTDGTAVGAEVKTIYADVLGGLDYAISTRAGGGTLTERMRIHSGGDISFKNTSASEEFYWDASASSLGIGTTSPDLALSVSSDSNNQAIFGQDRTTGESIIYVGSEAANNKALGIAFDNDNNRATFFIGGDKSLNPLVIDDGGNIGINKNSPTSTLDVNGTIAFNSLKDSGEDITITKFVDEADTIASNNNDTTIPTSAAVDAHINSKSTTDRNNSYKIMGLAMDYLSRVHNDGGVVEGMEDVMKNTEELILA